MPVPMIAMGTVIVASIPVCTDYADGNTCTNLFIGISFSVLAGSIWPILIHSRRRDELGLSEVHSANPLQAAFASGLTFTVAAAMPLIAAMLAPEGMIIPVVVASTLICLAALGALGAHAGGAPKLRPTLRVLFWGAAAMAITAGVGKLFGVSV